jgi:hypothetical protein
MALPIPSTSKAAESHDDLQQVHAGLVSSSKVTMPATVKGTSERRPARSIAERAQTHLAHDEARAKLDAGLQQRLEVADAALRLSASRSQSCERRRGPSARACRPW